MKTSLAVMVSDINGLKRIHDACRDYDYVARTVGDEFVVTAPGLPAAGVEEKVRRLNQAAIEAGRRTCGRDVITLSVGTAFCPDDGYEVEAWLAEADRGMYSMKQAHYAKLAEGEETQTQGAADQ